MATRVRIAALVVAGVVAIALAVLFGITQSRQGEILAGVTIEGTDVGGLGREDALVVVDDYADSRAAATITLTHEDQTFEVDPAAVGAGVDADAVVDEALAAGRGGSFIDDRVAALRGVEVDVAVPVSLDEDAVTGRVEEIAAEVDSEPVEGDVTVVAEELAVETVDPVDGVVVLVEETTTAVVAAFDEEGPYELDLPVEVLPTRTEQRDVDEAAALAAEIIADDLVLASEDGEVVLAPREVAPLLSTSIVGGEDDARIVLSVTEEAVEEHVVPVADPLLREPVNAGFEAPRSPPVQFDDMDDAVWTPRPAQVSITGGTNGTELDVATAAEQLTQALRSVERRVPLTLVQVPPPFSRADAEAAGVDALLSTFTTYHSCCQSRVTNIQRLADLVDGTIVYPGEQFSINQISGVRTCEKGFAEAGMILDGEIVDVCGGGVSQFGTTTVNAVFFAGLDPDAYKPHSFYISRYPMAREATLNYPSPDIDVRFTNDTGAPVIVRTSYTGTSITVSFYGNDDDLTEVRADVGAPGSVRSFSTERRINRELPAGSTTVVQSGLDGFTVPLTRTVVRPSGTTTDSWGNTYVAKKEIVEYNPG